MLESSASGERRHAGHDQTWGLAGQIRPLYQPIVDLDTRTTVAFEALIRGPQGSPLESPAALFGEARDRNLLAELDRACLFAACRGADLGGLRAPMALFVNVEPAVIGDGIDSIRLGYLKALSRRLPLFFEVTERSLTTRPAELLRTVDRLREAGFGIALDDVGADRRSLALLPLLRPDIVKLDMSLIHSHPSRRAGHVVNGVHAYAEMTGAVVLAEGVETEEQVLTARSMGASLAQGWYFGRPTGLPAHFSLSRASTRSLGLPPRSLPSTPSILLRGRRAFKIGSVNTLLSMTRALEAQALDLGEHVVVVAAFQHADFFTDRTRQRYEELGARASLVVALGEEFARAPAPGVLAVALASDDPLTREWDVAVLGPHFAGALIARELGDRTADRERRFEFVLTFDRELVVDVAATLISRLSQQG